MTVMPLKETRAVLSLGNPLEDHGYTNHWTSGQKTHLTPNCKIINCSLANCVPFVVLGLSTSSSTSPSPDSSTSSSQDTVIGTGNPATERSEIMSEESWRIPSRRISRNRNTNKNEDDEELRSEPLQEVLEWLQDFKENLVDKNVQPHQYSPSSSHESPMEPRAKVVPGPSKHSISSHFPKDRNCDICLKTQITRASCRRRTGTVVPGAEHVGDFITADHKVLSEGCESRNNHRYAAVVQDLATQWIQSYPCKTKTSQETQRSLQKFLERGILKSFTLTIPWNSAKLVKISPGIIARRHHTGQKQMGLLRAVRRVKEGTSAVLLQSGLDEKWWADFMECYSYLRNIQDLLSGGKTPYERRFGKPFKGPVIPFGAMVEYHPLSAKDQSRIHQFGKKVLPG